VIEAKLDFQQECHPAILPGVHEITDKVPQGVWRSIDGGVDAATITAKLLDRLSTHRSESFEPHNFELLCRWHSGEWVLRTILQGPL